MRRRRTTDTMRSTRGALDRASVNPLAAQVQQQILAERVEKQQMRRGIARLVRGDGDPGR